MIFFFCLHANNMWSSATKYSGRYYVVLRWRPMAQTFITRFNQNDHTIKKRSQWRTQDNTLSFWRGTGGGGGVTSSWLTFKPSLFRNQWVLSQWRIIHILRNSKDHYIFHNSPPLVPILSQINPVHTLSSYFLHRLTKIIRSGIIFVSRNLR